MSEESFRSFCDLYMFLLELYMCLGFTLEALRRVAVFLSGTVFIAISIKSFTIGNFVEIKSKRA